MILPNIYTVVLKIVCTLYKINIMINIEHVGRITSDEERVSAEKKSLDYIAGFEQEFEEGEGIIIIDHDKEETEKGRTTFNMNKGDIGNFIWKVQQSKSL